MGNGYTIGYLGPRGTFSEDALLNSLEGKEVPTREFQTNAAVLQALLDGEVEEIVIAYRNSLSGPVFDNLAWLIANPNVRIKGQIRLHIKQNLITISAATPVIKHVFSHEAAVGQCVENLANLYPGAELHALKTSTALAVRDLELLARGVTDAKTGQPLDPKFAAAIASQRAAEVYGKVVLRPGFQDHDRNFTDFWALARSDSQQTGKDRTLLVFLGVGNVDEFFSQVYANIHFAGLPVTWFETRGLRKSLTTAYFMVEVEGHRSDHMVELALRAIKRRAPEVKIRVCGSYPEPKTFESS